MSEGQARIDARRRARRRTVGQRRAVLGLVLLAAALGAIYLLNDGGGDADPLPAAGTRAPVHPAAHVTRAAPLHVVAHARGQLTAAVQDAAAAVAGGHVLVAAGLDAADTSTGDVRVLSGSGDTVRGQLPVRLHDAAAAAIGPDAYVFGGGDGVRQLDSIYRVDPASGGVSSVGRLPAASSDSAAAAIGGTAYVVGGYTGTRWLDTILAWRPGSAPRVVGRLPAPLRYAAVTAVGNRLVIAGGSLPSGAASRRILAFDPATRHLRTLGLLPAPTTHATAAPLGSLALIIGGRGATLDTPTARVVAVDPATGRVHAAGQLTAPVSDAMALGTGHAVLVVGGHAATGTRSAITELVPGRSTRRVLRVATATAATVAPAVAGAAGVYAHDLKGMLSPRVRGEPALVYVPNSQDNTVDVISQRTFRVIRTFSVGALPQHVTPAWNLRRLWVDNDDGNSLTPIDPHTGRQSGPPVPVDDPYNLYFTPDGHSAIVVAERLRRLDFRNPATMHLQHSLAVPECPGVDHMDFSANGRVLIASCEFGGRLIKVDLRTRRVVATLRLGSGIGAPQDVKLSPDGRLFYVADMVAGGVWEISARRFRVVGFLATGRGAHGLYPSRDARYLYVTNRSAGTVSVVSFRTRHIVATWTIPGGSPDMGGVSANGHILWLSGRYNAEVYALDTRTGKLLARIPVGAGPHGLAVWPQPGRYSLGHTGIMR
jgi:DNA-binding beta-propeller fold protein YncE